MTDPLRVRRLREQLAAVSQYVTDLHMPIHEGYRFAPLIVEDCFDSLSGILHEFDLQLAKIDGGSGVGEEARELTMAAIEAAEAMAVEKYGSPQGNSKRYENACRALIAAAAQADARMLDEAIEEQT